MQLSQDFTAPTPVPADMGALARLTEGLGFDIVEIAGFLDQIEAQADARLTLLRQVRDDANAILRGNNGVRDAVAEAQESTSAAQAAIDGSMAMVRASGQQGRTVASWVRALDERMGQVAGALVDVEANNDEIAGIAAQVNILAINAKIEAARAGDAGRGFAVVAEAINELSQKTAQAAEQIALNISTLSTWVRSLRQESDGVRSDADKVLASADQTDKALASIGQRISETTAAAGRIAAQSAQVDQASNSFAPVIGQLGRETVGATRDLHKARERIHGLVDLSEEIVQKVIQSGGASADQVYIDRVRADAKTLSDLLDQAIDSRRITLEGMFDTAYQPAPPIPGVTQLTTAFTGLTDALFPPVLEAAREALPNALFCAAIDRNGYLPTHNAEFSQSPGRDPDWNNAHCRNRRIFDDRVGLKAGRNIEPFLVQVYRRDMGGDAYQIMKDVSAPIRVKGRHWGALRLAYRT